jgi:hypothetical protein
MKIYFSAVYFAAVTTTTIGYGDFSGSLHSEILFLIICIAIGSIYYSFFVSIIGNVFSNRSLRANMLNEYIGYIEELKRKFGIPDDLAVQLRIHYESVSKMMTFSETERKYNFYELLPSFPPSVQHEVRLEIYKSHIESVPFLISRCSKFYVEILPLLILHTYLKQSFLFKESQIAKFAIILVKGKALNMTLRTIIKEGTMIGEVDILKF